MKKIFSKIASLAVATVMVLGPSQFAFAAAATDLSDDMSRQKIGEVSQHVINFTLPTALTVGQDVDITFPGFDLATNTITVSASTPTATINVNGQVVELNFGVQAADTDYSVTLEGIINPATAGNRVIDIQTDAGDDGEITVPILDEDQIFVTAKVAQALFFDVRDASDTDNAVDFGTLTAGTSRFATDAAGGDTAKTGASEFEAGTNAAGGYTVAVAGATLTSGVNTIDAVNPAAPANPAAEQFGIAVVTSLDTGADHGTIDAAYSGTNYFLDVANEDVIATRTTPAANSTYDVDYIGNITAATEAGQYSTALTYTMTANF